MPTKSWFLSKTLWSDVATIALGVVALVDKDFGTHLATSHWYQMITIILGGAGIIGRVTANTTLTS